MRQLKFRVWDKEYKRMYQGEGILDAISTNGDNRIFYFQNYTSLANDKFQLKIEIGDPKDFIIMQWTGLKDKNDKEIYEGDRVETIYGTQGVIEYYLGQYDPKTLGTGQGGFGCIGGYVIYEGTEKYGSHSIRNINTVKKVIGNIYEKET